MTARVMLDLDDGQQPGAQWLEDLLAWDLSHLWGEQAQARCTALVMMVARCHTHARAHGPLAWPTLHQLARWLRAPSHADGWTSCNSEVTQLLTVAIAAGWLRYEDDGAGQ